MYKFTKRRWSCSTCISAQTFHLRIHSCNTEILRKNWLVGDGSHSLLHFLTSIFAALSSIEPASYKITPWSTKNARLLWIVIVSLIHLFFDCLQHGDIWWLVRVCNKDGWSNIHPRNQISKTFSHWI